MTPESEAAPYRVALPEFEGPLDLLLHLCKTHEIDILNIPIAFITEKYLSYLDLMQSVSVDVAAEYLLMAATLAYLKARELVPAPEPLEAGEDGEEELLDPREELIRRLLEYQKYKDAAERLGARPIEGKTIFGRGVDLRETDENAPLADHSVWKLIEAFARILDKKGKKHTHEVLVDRVSIGSRINQLIDKLELGNGAFRFDQCLDFELPEVELRSLVVVTILAVLELARMKVVRVLASDDGDTLYVTQIKGASLAAARAVQITSAVEPEADGEVEQAAPEGATAGSRPGPSASARVPLFPQGPRATPVSSRGAGEAARTPPEPEPGPSLASAAPGQVYPPRNTLEDERARQEEDALGELDQALARADSVTIAAADALGPASRPDSPDTSDGGAPPPSHGETEEDL